jgi:transposase-like protein
MYMWRAVDSEGEVLEILVQPQRDKVAALRLAPRVAMSARKLLPKLRLRFSMERKDSSCHAKNLKWLCAYPRRSPHRPG